MSVLLDTNILARSAQPAHPMHQEALDAVCQLKTHGEDLCIISQILIEFWAVATRPQFINGLQMNVSQAAAELTRIKSLFRFLPDTAAIHDEWEKLVTLHAVSGKNAHDARIVAAMKTHGLEKLLTFNGDDFKRYVGVTIISPVDVK